MNDELLPDRWHSRDFPVLLETARQLDSGQNVVQGQEVAVASGLSSEDVQSAWHALHPTYINVLDMGQSAAQTRPDLAVANLTERGRRAVGLWPREDEAADAFIELLSQAADQLDDEDDAGALRKAGRLLKSVPSAVLADVTAALIRQQTGL